MSWFSPYNRFERDLLSNIKKTGCHINFVGESPEGPSLAYSIGFAFTVRQPEVIVFGMNIDEVHFVINDLLRQCKGGLKLIDGIAIKTSLAGLSLRLKSVCPSNIKEEFLNSAIWYHNTILKMPLVEVLQIYWPSAIDGHFPWEDQASEEFRRLQPSLQSEVWH